MINVVINNNITREIVEKRTWKERLFSKPFRPFQKMKTVSCAAQLGYDIYTHESQLPEVASRLIDLNVISQSNLVYEDSLPDMTDKEYSEWYKTSFLVDGVRMGFKI